MIRSLGGFRAAGASLRTIRGRMSPGSRPALCRMHAGGGLGGTCNGGILTLILVTNSSTEFLLSDVGGWSFRAVDGNWTAASLLTLSSDYPELQLDVADGRRG